MYNIELDNGIVVGYEEREIKKDLRTRPFQIFEKYIEVRKDNELILNNKGKTIEEFLNYLGFMVGLDIIEEVKFIYVHGDSMENFNAEIQLLNEELYND